MFDRYSQKLVYPALNLLGVFLLRIGLTPNFLSWSGIFFGVSAAVSIYYSFMLLGLLFILINRICDGLDGQMARETEVSDYGGFLDIVFDFFFYAIIPLSFGLQKEENLIPALFLLVSFLLNGSSFLAYAAIKASNTKNQRNTEKSFHYSDGLIEGSETILFFILFCLFPEKFSLFCYIFCFLTCLTFLQRLAKAKAEFKG